MWNWIFGPGGNLGCLIVLFFLIETALLISLFLNPCSMSCGENHVIYLLSTNFLMQGLTEIAEGQFCESRLITMSIERGKINLAAA